MLVFLLKQIVGELSAQGPLTRPQLAEATKTPRTTVYDHLIELELVGVVSSYQKPRTTRGRPETVWVLNRNYWDEGK